MGCESPSAMAQWRNGAMAQWRNGHYSIHESEPRHGAEVPPPLLCPCRSLSPERPQSRPLRLSFPRPGQMIPLYISIYIYIYIYARRSWSLLDGAWASKTASRRVSPRRAKQCVKQRTHTHTHTPTHIGRVSPRRAKAAIRIPHRPPAQRTRTQRRREPRLCSREYLETLAVGEAR